MAMYSVQEECQTSWDSLLAAENVLTRDLACETATSAWSYAAFQGVDRRSSYDGRPACSFRSLQVRIRPGALGDENSRRK